VARLLVCFRSGAVYKRVFISKQDCVKEIGWRGEQKISEILARFAAQAFVKGLRIGAPITAAYVLIKAANADLSKLEEFFTRLCSGTDLDANDPILWLRQRLMSKQVQIDNRRGEARLETILRYWNAWLRGRTVTSHLQNHGRFPEIATGF